jgi:hypothetical protein
MEIKHFRWKRNNRIKRKFNNQEDLKQFRGRLGLKLPDIRKKKIE